MSTSLISQIESLLFVASKPLTTAHLASLCAHDPAAVETALQELQTMRANSGVVLLHNQDQWQLATHPDNVDLVKNFLTADLREKLTDASMEVLAIIAYRGPIGRPEIEAIRGVNCQYSLRQLLMRGLVEKISNPGQRSQRYQLTTDFLSHMGISRLDDLPEYARLKNELKLPSQTATTSPGPDAGNNSQTTENPSTD